MSSDTNTSNNIDNDYIEIDLLQIFSAIRRHWLIVLLATMICGICTGVYSKFLIVPQYESKAVVFILTKETTLTSLADLQIGSQLTNDYKVVVTSRTVLQQTIEDLGLQELYTYKQLRDRISVENPQNTRILEIKAIVPNPEMAKAIVDSIAKNSAEYIADTMEITPPKIIESGEIPDLPTKPNNVKNAMLGALIGFVLAVVIIVLINVLNDSVKNEEDVEKYLGLSVLGSLPDRSISSDKKKKKKKVSNYSRTDNLNNGRSRAKKTK
ncbi:MAG: Wzz/FepE/Etk N-terminal domain-containing protein [Lachnospiraceae bacterium]|nr:Wzz/FepE/Etk N-terminal domain-containing protein [Lachnospiraceae bacterium]